MDYMRRLADWPWDAARVEHEPPPKREEEQATSSYIVGLDLGQSHDWTAISVLQRVQAGKEKARYQLRHLERPQLGTLYPAVVERVRDLLNTGELMGRSTLVVDATGVGAPVVDMLRQAGLRCPIKAVTITGGNAVNREGHDYTVPKRDLVSATQVLFQCGRLKAPPVDELPLGRVFVEELLNFKVKISTKGHDTYEAWREGVHDDLVLSVALACWYGETQRPMHFSVAILRPYS